MTCEFFLAFNILRLLLSRLAGQPFFSFRADRITSVTVLGLANGPSHSRLELH
jgi:hypothetical protein